MIGVFDSGVGGFNSLKPLRERLPFIDIAYLADRKNAPYGTRSEEEILTLATRNIERLTDMGAAVVLIACCTASTLWERLPEKQKDLSLPIISPTVRSLSGEEKRVLVIATERTARSGRFKKEIQDRFPSTEVFEVAMQSLVAAVEMGSKNGNVRKATEPEMRDLLRICERYSPDTLILGCTHFSSVENIIKELLLEVKILSPARIGAIALAERVCAEGICTLEGGRIIYT